MKTSTAIVIVWVLQCASSQETDLSQKKHETLWRSTWSWWNTLSQQKSVKCIMPNWNPDTSSKLKINKLQDLIFCYKCHQNVTQNWFKISGKIELRDGLCNGAAKLTVLEAPEPATAPFICVTMKTPLTEVIGTFRNGSLIGQFKLKTLDGEVHISKFLNGEVDGLYRKWDSNGFLIQAFFLQNGHFMGPCWVRNSQTFLVQYNCSSLDPSEGSAAQAVLLHHQRPEQVFRGHYCPVSNVASNLAPVILDAMDPEIGDACMLSLKSNILSENVSKPFSLLLSESRFLDEDNRGSLCQREEETAPQYLLRWFQDSRNVEYFLYEKDDRIESQFVADQSRVFVSQVRFEKDDLGFCLLNNSIKLSLLPVQVSLDRDHYCHGFCHFISNHSEETLMNVTYDVSLDWLPKEFRGNFVHGLPEGFIDIELLDGRTLHASIRRGILHGPAVINYTLPIIQMTRSAHFTTQKTSYGLVGTYINGRLGGPVWIGLHGQGYFYGNLKDSDGYFSGPNMLYVYPDMELALFGHFEKYQMKSAQESNILKVATHWSNLPEVSELSEPSGPIFYYDPPTNSSFGAGPPGVVDPLEKKYVRVGLSSTPNAGLGLFAVRDIPRGLSFALLSGYLFPQDEWDRYQEECILDETKTADQKRHCWKYAVGVSALNKTMHTPEEVDGPGQFHPTLSIKVNHHFTKNCSDFQEFEHPRWGMVACLFSTKPIKAGQEIFSYYKYTKEPFPVDFPWYWEAKKALEDGKKTD